MPLIRTGDMLGPYEIQYSLGAGGMGVVYQARDTGLGRQVAIKVVPENLHSSDRARQRLKREARAASSLNHPNICTIYAIEESNGRLFIVMELLEGATLARLIETRELPQKRLVDLAIQFTDGLDAAHRKGIVHRDIKPANLFLTTQGTAKILDFGLAKQDFQEAGDTLTGSGAVAGTVAYMSPEQARGEELDARSDLFSFGTVLYEMVTGRQAFEGATMALVHDGILNRSPAPPHETGRAVPPLLESIIAKALEKDRRRRYQTAAELRDDLRRLQDGSHSGILPAPAAFPAESLPGVPVAKHGSDSEVIAGLMKRHRVKVGAVLAVVMAMALSFGYLLYRGANRLPPQPALEFVRVTGSGNIQCADLSPDGKYVAYVRVNDGNQSLWLKQLATGRDAQLADLGADHSPGVGFSADGSYVYFARQGQFEPSGDLYQVPRIGGHPRKVLTGISGAPAFSPDGARVAFVRSTQITHGEDTLVTAALDGSAERLLASYKAPGISYNLVAWSPDGKSLIYPLETVLTTIGVEGGQARPLPGHHWDVQDLTPLPGGRDLIVAGNLREPMLSQLFSISMDGGEPRQITNDVATYMRVRVSADGKTLLALQRQILSTVQLVTPGKEAAVSILSSDKASRDGRFGLAWTPAGKIVYASAASGRDEVWKMDAGGSARERLSYTNDKRIIPSDLSVSLNGAFITYTQWSEKDHANIWRVDMDGRNPKRLTGGRQDSISAVSPDGRWIVYSSVQGDKSILMKAPVNGGAATQLTDYYSDRPAISPDGRSISCLYSARRNQPLSLAIVPIAGGPPAQIFALPATAIPESQLAWTPDGRAISFINHISGAANIWNQPVAGGPPKQVTHFAADRIFAFAWLNDGQLAISRGAEPVDAVLIKDFR